MIVLEIIHSVSCNAEFFGDESSQLYLTTIRQPMALFWNVFWLVLLLFLLLVIKLFLTPLRLVNALSTPILLSSWLTS